ncbi:fimbrial protein [Escherichia coli O8:H8]|nr:fimbrial protein [Escherichia coli O8:H8]EFE2135166.1 fimbrial protein [Escherichia coli O8:H8]EFE2154820.1 fimbrial protein [Escherichia coli O8:H8]
MKLKHVGMIVVSVLAMSSAAVSAAEGDESVTTTVNGGVIHFKGEVVNAACAIDSESMNQTVELGQVRSSRLAKAGDLSSAVGFNIKLNDCDTNVSSNAAVAFLGTTVTSNDDTLALQSSAAGSAQNVGIQNSVIKISGRVLDYGCTVSSDSLNFTVDLQKNSARQFPTTGSTSPVVPFQITLSECSKGTTGVRVAFNGIEDAENNTLLKLDEGSNTASGLGIEILDANMRPVKLNDLHAGMQWIPLVPEQNNILPYSARLKSTQKSVNPGLVRASATFTLEFQ